MHPPADVDRVDLDVAVVRDHRRRCPAPRESIRCARLQEAARLERGDLPCAGHGAAEGRVGWACGVGVAGRRGRGCGAGCADGRGVQAPDLVGVVLDPGEDGAGDLVAVGRRARRAPSASLERKAGSTRTPGQFSPRRTARCSNFSPAVAGLQGVEDPPVKRARQDRVPGVEGVDRRGRRLGIVLLARAPGLRRALRPRREHHHLDAGRLGVREKRVEVDADEEVRRPLVRDRRPALLRES